MIKSYEFLRSRKDETVNMFFLLSEAPDHSNLVKPSLRRKPEHQVDINEPEHFSTQNRKSGGKQRKGTCAWKVRCGVRRIKPTDISDRPSQPHSQRNDGRADVQLSASSNAQIRLSRITSTTGEKLRNEHSRKGGPPMPRIILYVQPFIRSLSGSYARLHQTCDLLLDLLIRQT